jgi:hypothetical protein
MVRLEVLLLKIWFLGKGMSHNKIDDEMMGERKTLWRLIAKKVYFAFNGAELPTLTVFSIISLFGLAITFPHHQSLPRVLVRNLN